MNKEFYIGYRRRMPPPTARFVRRRLILTLVVWLGLAATLPTLLPIPGTGSFNFGTSTAVSGTVRCLGNGAALLSSAEIDYLLTGPGKHGAPLEYCAEEGREVTTTGRVIERDGQRMLDVEVRPQVGLRGRVHAPEPRPLGRMTLIGEIVDSKCYFGVMNPGEGRLHQACAVLCLRGSIPAVFVARDRSGAVRHLVITGKAGADGARSLQPWVGSFVEAEGEVFEVGHWLTWNLDPDTLKAAH